VAYCAASDDNGGLFHIQVANEHDIIAADVSPATALIKVESGEVSQQLLLSTLARIVPVTCAGRRRRKGTSALLCHSLARRS
jgi:hypothetical protein